MMNRWVSFLITFAVVTSAWAQVPASDVLPAVSADDLAKINESREAFRLSELHKDPLYIQTKKVCSKEDFRKSLAGEVRFQWEKTRVFASSAWQIFRIAGLLDIEEASRLYHQHGISPRMAELIGSAGFGLALDECFPGDHLSQVVFKGRLGVADTTGKIIGGGASVFFWVYGGTYLAGATKVMRPTTLKIVTIGAAAAALGYSGKSVYDYLKRKKSDAASGNSQTFIKMEDHLQNLSGDIEKSTMKILDEKLAKSQRDLADAQADFSSNPMDVKALEDRMNSIRLAREDFLLTLAGR